MPLKPALAVLLAATLPLLACDRACTLVGCGSPLQVDLERAAWTPGTYEVTVVADGETTVCSATLPLDCDAPPACGASSELIVGLSGCAGPPSEHKLGPIELPHGTAPKSVEVRVAQDGALIGEAVYTPTYTESYPNGPDCGPPCFGAESVTLTLQ